MSLISNSVIVLLAAVTVSSAGTLYATNFPYNYPSPYATRYSYGHSPYILPLTYSWEIKHHHPDHKEDTSKEDNKSDPKTDNAFHMPQTTSELNRYSFSYPVLYAIPTPLSWSNSAQFHIQDKFGQYLYGYANPQSSKQEVKTLDGIIQGLYSYIDGNGEVQTVKYISDQSGFRVAATNLPKSPRPVEIPDSPEIMLAKKQHFQAQKEALDRLNAANINEGTQLLLE